MLFPDACPPLYRYTDPNVLQVEKQMFGIISSAMAYGAVVLLFGDCCNHLLKTRHISSRQTRIQLFIFSLSMTLLSTGALVQGILYLLFQSGMFKRTPTEAMLAAPGERVLAMHLIDLGIPLTLPFLVLGANAFMSWRCIVLFRSTSKGTRITITFLLSFLFIISLIGAVLFFLQSSPSLSGAIDFFVPIQTPLVSIVLFNVILLRLFLHTEFLERVTGFQDRITDMFVECCALVMAVSVLHLVFASVEYNGAMITLQLLPHACAISPFLVILRLAEGKGAVILRPGEIHKAADKGAGRLTTIEFARDSLTSDSEDDVERSQSPPASIDYSIEGW